MREYIKRSMRAAVMCFKRSSDTDYNRMDEIDAHNMAVADRAFKAVMDGRADYAYMRDGSRLIVYTQSLRGDFVQASYFFNVNGDDIATMHTDIHNVRDMERTFIPGRYINIAA